jgi:tetratricopeptide (TPR) repeat protein
MPSTEIKAMMEQARLHTRDENYETAADLYKRVIKMSRNDKQALSECYFELAKICKVKNKNEGALVCLKKVSDLNIHIKDAYEWLQLACKNSQDFKDIKKVFKLKVQNKIPPIGHENRDLNESLDNLASNNSSGVNLGGDTFSVYNDQQSSQNSIPQKTNNLNQNPVLSQSAKTSFIPFGGSTTELIIRLLIAGIVALVAIIIVIVKGMAPWSIALVSFSVFLANAIIFAFTHWSQCSRASIIALVFGLLGTIIQILTNSVSSHGNTVSLILLSHSCNIVGVIFVLLTLLTWALSIDKNSMYLENICYELGRNKGLRDI